MVLQLFYRVKFPWNLLSRARFYNFAIWSGREIGDVAHRRRTGFSRRSSSKRCHPERSAV